MLSLSVRFFDTTNIQKGGNVLWNTQTTKGRMNVLLSEIFYSAWIFVIFSKIPSPNHLTFFAYFPGEITTTCNWSVGPPPYTFLCSELYLQPDITSLTCVLMKNISREIDQSLRLRHCERLEEQRICLYIYLYTYGFMCFQDKRIST